MIFVLPNLGKKAEKDENLPMYSDKLVSYLFYTTDYDLDINDYPEYLERDRSLHYCVNGSEFAITDGNYAKYGSAVAFFGEYFEKIIAGDVNAYNAMFTENYYKTNERHWDFAPQMLYDIKVEQLSQSVSEDTGKTTYAFNVSYKIYRNDGTFRNDIDSDASKTLYFELIDDGQSVKIDRITYYVKK